MDSAAVHLPGSRFNLEVVLRSSHPFLAEYDRWLVVKDEENTIRSQLKLFPDTGGYALVNLYQAGSHVTVRTMGNEEYRLEMSTGLLAAQPTTTEELRPRPSDAVFLGSFDFGDDDVWKFIPATMRQEKEIGVVH